MTGAFLSFGLGGSPLMALFHFIRKRLTRSSISGELVEYTRASLRSRSSIICFLGPSLIVGGQGEVDLCSSSDSRENMASI
jgi:hypothetical protein